MRETLLKPFARWENFAACKHEQMEIGHSEESAQKICRAIQARAEKGELFKALPDLEILKTVGDDLVVGGYASWELVDPQNDYITTEAMVNFLAKFFNLPSEYRNISIDHTNFQIGKALLRYPDVDPKCFSHVHEKGMYLIAKIRKDQLGRTKKYREQIRKGIYKMFSISGEPIRSEQLLMDNEIVRKVYDIDPFEVAIVKEGYNPKANFEILKQKAGQPKTDKERLVAHFGEEKALKLLELIGEEAYKLLPQRGQKVEKQDLQKPFADYKDRADCVRQNQGKVDDPHAFCAWLEQRTTGKWPAEKAILKILKIEPLDKKAWMQNCREICKDLVKDPEQFCGAFWHDRQQWYHGPVKVTAQPKVATELQDSEKIFHKYFPAYKRGDP